MELVDSSAEAGLRHVSVNLRRGDVGVTKQRLHAAQVGAAFEKMGCE